MSKRFAIPPAELFVALEREFRSRADPGCGRCSIPLPVALPEPERRPNWHVQSPQPCRYGCHDVIREVVSEFGNRYDILVWADGTVPDDAQAQRTVQSRFAALLEHIKGHLADPMPITELAQRVSLSPYHFARVFRRLVGQPPHDYIVARRMEHACALLEQTSIPIEEITRLVGYRTQAHFTAAFRRRVGKPPAAYRREKRSRGALQG